MFGTCIHQVLFPEFPDSFLEKVLSQENVCILHWRTNCPWFKLLAGNSRSIIIHYFHSELYFKYHQNWRFPWTSFKRIPEIQTKTVFSQVQVRLPSCREDPELMEVISCLLLLSIVYLIGWYADGLSFFQDTMLPLLALSFEATSEHMMSWKVAAYNNSREAPQYWPKDGQPSMMSLESDIWSFSSGTADAVWTPREILIL